MWKEDNKKTEQSVRNTHTHSLSLSQLQFTRFLFAISFHFLSVFCYAPISRLSHSLTLSSTFLSHFQCSVVFSRLNFAGSVF
ncbi:hypothetical protein RIF29_16739 [Crotalaria pallida]|uniref:Transmembrane protein n=1 Tax=Crotalaria pallida TaxID=3830 RepID=A0AAN9IER1_CROPI